MARETSISEDLIDKFTYISDLVKEKYGACVWFAEILGNRWSYIAGQKEGEVSILPPQRIRLSKRFGIVSDTWEKIPVTEKGELLSSLKGQIKIYGQG